MENKSWKGLVALEWWIHNKGFLEEWIGNAFTETATYILCCVTHPVLVEALIPRHVPPPVLLNCNNYLWIGENLAHIKILHQIAFCQFVNCKFILEWMQQRVIAEINQEIKFKNVPCNFSLFLSFPINWKRLRREAITDDLGQITEELLPNSPSFGKMPWNTQCIVTRANVWVVWIQRFVMILYSLFIVKGEFTQYGSEYECVRFVYR